MGRNIEGVRAGSLAWFGKEPDHLSDAEAALLVALPRDPTRLRPDRVGTMAEVARARVLRRAAADGVLPDGALASALAAPMPASRHPMPMLAPHLGEQLARRAPAGARIATTLDGTLQAGAERVLAQALDATAAPRRPWPPWWRTGTAATCWPGSAARTTTTPAGPARST